MGPPTLPVWGGLLIRADIVLSHRDVLGTQDQDLHVSGTGQVWQLSCQIILVGLCGTADVI